MRITDEQKERAAYVNLPQFLMAHGFDLKRVGKEYVWKEHDSLHIKDNDPGERGAWFRFSEDKGGDNIGFLREYMGMSFVDAVEALTGEHIDRTYTPSRTYEQKPKAVTARDLSLAEADNARRVFAYLCKTRGLDYDMVSALVRGGSIAQEEKTGNVLFKYYDTDGIVIGAEKVGTSTDHKFKGIATGSAAGHGFEVVRGTGEKALFFESAIDMLSYLQMHDKELTDCRLVSMMGVKPNIVLDTMLRHNISPENVFLCSDNDTAGNDFAQRLQEQYPDMKRVITPDTYKDWNDMLRGIPKAVEHETEKKEVQQTDMQRYGNEMWHKATDNRDKSLVTIQAADFARLQEQLDRSGINYYAYARDNSVIMAINDKDVEWFKRIAGAPDLVPTKSNRPYSPPEKNVFGSAEYRYIPNKEYLSADRDLVLKMAEIMKARGMQFSGRVYPSSKGTLTVSHADLFAVRNIRDEVVNMRKQFASPDKAQEVGNRDYRANRDTHYYMSKLTPEQFKEVKPFLETSVSYHAVVRDGKVAFAVDKENAPAFHRALENAVRETNMLRKMADLGLSMEQNIALSPVVHRLAVEDMQLDLADFFDSRYDEAQFGEMLSLVNTYIAQAPAERYGENSKLTDMLEAKSSFDRSIELSDFFSLHDFSDEQRAAITAMFVGDVTRGQIDSIDETFTPEDIQAYDEILHNALQESDIEDFLAEHAYSVQKQSDRDQALADAFASHRDMQLSGSSDDLINFRLHYDTEINNGEGGYNLIADRTAAPLIKDMSISVISDDISFDAFKDFLSSHDLAFESVIDTIVPEKQATEEEVLFSQADLARFLAEHTLSSDEWESMSYPLFERGYLEKHQPSDKASFGYHLPEKELYALAERYHHGDDIRRELALGLMIHASDNIADKDKVEFVFEDGKISDRTFYYGENLRHTMDLSYGDDGITCSFSGMEEKGFEILSKAEKPVVEAPEQAEPEDKGPVSLRKVGDFYEMYGKNAEIGVEVLGLRMLSKNGQPMVGFPDHVKDEYSDKLREAGYTVLIEQAFELNPPKREAEKLQTLQQVVDKFFGTDCESAETEGGTWKLSIADGEKVGELFYGGEPVCGIYNRGDKMEIEPYRELTTFPALLRTAMLEHNPDKPVEIMDFQRTFATPLDKAKWLINDFCEAEYRDGADFDDLHHVSLAHTTLTDDELPVQVTADLVDFKITYEFDGEVYNTDQYDSIEDMIENGLTGLDFSDLVSVPDEVIEGHTAKDKQKVNLMSDAADISDTSSPADNVPAVTLKYKGDAESLDEIKDKVLSLGATVIIDNADGVISIDTYENHKAEIDGAAYELGLMAVDDAPAVETPAQKTADIDKPLFTDAAVIEEIQRGENDDVPFWEKPDIQGEQLSLFGDLEPLTASKPAHEKPKSEFSKGPVVDGVQVYEALAAEIDRGTGFVHGKLRVQDFYEDKHPTIQQLADFLKKEYGTGGHSGEGKISLVDYNSQGITFSFENGEKFRHSWYNVATMTESRLRDDTYLSAEQKAERAALKAEKAEEQSRKIVEVGDRFRHKITGEVSEVISLTGALPFYSDDCTIQRESSGFAVTENISYDKLLNSGMYEYIGKAEPEKEQSAPVKPEKAEVTPDNSAVAPEAEKPEIPTVKNLSQLKKTIKPGMMFEISDHLRLECIGERRVVTGVTTVDFTSRKLDENGEPTGKDLHMEFDRAKNWTFDGGELTSRLDNGDMLMSFHFIDSLEREQTVQAEKEPELPPEKTAPELSVGDLLEYKGKEYKVESLDIGGFITLADTAFEDAPRISSRVTFLTDEFIRSGEYKVITPTVEAPATDKGENFTITDDALGGGGAKAKFRANVDAIKTLKTLEREKRPATAEEKETLSKYVGWGALAKAFDKDDPKWAGEYKELSELLTPQEYAQARSTVNDAFYTSPTVIDGIYEALGNFGFDGGNVLEPAMDIGNFFGRMPEAMQAHAQLYGVEIDSLSGRIAQALYPDADIAISGFEKNSFQNGCFDVAVGNVPFGELGFKDTVHDTTKLHDLFFAEALDNVSVNYG